MAKHGFDGPYARDDHRDGLTDEYARDGGWSGGGRAEDVVHDEEPIDATDAEVEVDVHNRLPIGS